MVDALALADAALGSEDGAATSASVLAYLRARQGTEGLFWNGPSERGGGYASDCVESFCQSRAALGLVTWLQATGADAATAALDQLVAGLGAIAVWDGDAAYFPGSQWRNGWLETTLTPAGAPDGRAKYGWGNLVALPLARYFELTGAPAAGELTAALLRFFVERSGLVADDGRFAGHVHAEGYAGLAAAAARYATLAGWDAWLAWAARLFEYLRARGTRYGFVPDRIGLGPSYYWYWYGHESLPTTCETCGLVDALELGITLAERGHPEYWDDVERWTRNHLLASQIGAPETWAAASAGRDAPAALTAAVTPDSPLARVVEGAFDSASSPGRLLDRADGGPGLVVEGCCASSGLRGLFLAWQHAVADDGTVVSVHLNLSRTSPAAEVVSYEPSAGRLDVRLSAARTLRLRVSVGRRVKRWSCCATARRSRLSGMASTCASPASPPVKRSAYAIRSLSGRRTSRSMAHGCGCTGEVGPWWGRARRGGPRDVRPERCAFNAGRGADLAAGQPDRLVGHPRTLAYQAVVRVPQPIEPYLLDPWSAARAA